MYNYFWTLPTLINDLLNNLLRFQLYSSQYTKQPFLQRLLSFKPKKKKVQIQSKMKLMTTITDIHISWLKLGKTIYLEGNFSTVTLSELSPD